MEPKEIIASLCSSKKLERDNAINDLEKFLTTCTVNDRLFLENILIEFLNNSSTSWETKQGCLTGAKSVIPFIDKDIEQECEFSDKIRSIAEKCLTNVEVRVRTEAGAVLGMLCQKFGPNIYREERDYVMQLIQNSLERQVMDDEASHHEYEETERLIEKLSQRRNSSEVIQISRETAGWKNLETSLHCLQSMVLGCGNSFQPFIDNDLLSLIFQTLVHTNRFVQETGFYLCSALVHCANVNKELEESDSDCSTNPILNFGRKISEHLALGLADNWSQVKLAASHATRHFLLSLPDTKAREVFYPQLLPRICLNRYYIAEGVRIYSQETWRQVTGEYGRELVEKYVDSFVMYYQEATASDNHAVREAACSCIAELASKVDSEIVKPHVHGLLNVLLTCFQDSSWPVRDASCLACGNFILAFPTESQPMMEILYPLFFSNLGDSIASVRQGAATSLKNVVKAYSADALGIIMDRIRKNFKGISSQVAAGPSEITEISHYGISKRRRDNDDDSHLNSDKWRLGRRGSYIGPIHKQDSQPWEHADGSVILLGELSEIPSAADQVLDALPYLSEACKFQHYAQHVVFLETVCRHLPIFTKNLGVKRFKTMLDLFIDPIFSALMCENALASSTASQCLNQLGSMIGSSILRSRVMNHNPRYVEHLDANIFIAPF